MYSVDVKINYELLAAECLKVFSEEISNGVSINGDPHVGEAKIAGYCRDGKLSLHSSLIGTYTESLIISISSMYRFEKICIRELRARRCYEYHTDEHNGLNIHIPLSGNFESCFFIIDNVSYRLDFDNKIYIFDGSIRHTAINASDIPRFHLHFGNSSKR